MPVLKELIQPSVVRRAGAGMYPILSMTMRDGLVDQSSKFKKRVASEDTSQYRIVSRGQLVVGFPIDEAVLAVQQIYGEAIVSPAYGIWDIAGSVNPSYLQRFLRSPQAIAYYVAKLRGTTARRRSLPNEVFLQLNVPLPPLTEQRRIADVLDRADALRTKRREALALLDDLTQSIFLDMFGDPQTNPQGWVRRPLGSIVRGIDNGSSPICEARPASEDEWGVLKLSALTRGTFDAAENKAYLGAVDAMARNEVRSGDLLMTRKNTRDLVGAVALVRDVRPRLLMPDLVFRLDVNEGVARKSYLQALLMHPRKRPEIAGLSNGSAASMPNISKARLRTLPLELPPLESQLEFERRGLAVQNLHSRTLEAADADHDLFDALQQRAFSGLL